MELNAEKVKKALECCLTTSEGDCIACGYRGKKDGLFVTCTNCLIADALALINSQEQRIKELAEENERLTINMNAYGLAAKRLGEEKNQFLDTIVCLEIDLEKAKANAVRAMQAEIINRCIQGGIYPAFVATTIDKIAKEMIDNVGT